MPVDADGNRADIIACGNATVNRSNPGRLYEAYITGCARDVLKRIKKELHIFDKISENKLRSIDANKLQDSYNYLLGFYNIINKEQYNFYSNLTEDKKYDHLLSIINDKIYLFMPIEDEKDRVDRILELEEYCKPTYGRVTYVGNSGKLSVTKLPVRIAPVYHMLLEKIADDWSSVNVGVLQHLGVLAPIPKSEKYGLPYRQNPVRLIGETEARVFAGYCGRQVTAEMLDISNNPASMRNIVYNILNADKPTNIEKAVDRKIVPLGGHRPINIVEHKFIVAGFRTKYVPENISYVQMKPV